MGTSFFKKLAGAAVVAGVVFMTVSCADRYARYLIGGDFVEGVAQPGITTWYWDFKCPDNLPDCSDGPRKVDECGNAGGIYVGFIGNGSCRNIPRDLSNLPRVGTADSENECSFMAGQANYFRYHFNPQSGKCLGEGKYEDLGIKDTKQTCVAAAKQAGFPDAVYLLDTKKCLGTQRYRWDVPYAK